MPKESRKRALPEDEDDRALTRYVRRIKNDFPALGPLYIPATILPAIIPIEVTDNEQKLRTAVVTACNELVKDATLGSQIRAVDRRLQAYDKFLTDFYEWRWGQVSYLAEVKEGTGDPRGTPTAKPFPTASGHRP